MRVLVTGAAGLIGSWLCEGFLKEGHSVIGVDDLSGGELENLPKQPDPRFKFYKTDLADYAATDEIFRGNRPEIVYHVASCAREGASTFQPAKICKTNMMISMNVLELGIKNGMRRFIFTSSMSVYGNGRSKPPFNESMKSAPVDPYGQNKEAIESIIWQLAEVHKFEACILRPHNCFGERASLSDPYRNVVSIFCQRIKRKEPLYIFGKNFKRAFSYMGDCIQPMMNAAFFDQAVGETINIGGADAITIEELANTVIAEFPEYAKPEIIHIPPRPHEVPDAWCTIDKSVELLKYKENIGWREGVKRFCAWAKAHPQMDWKADMLPLLTEDSPLPWREVQQIQNR